MKQYTTPEQTAKLIELGFEKPKSVGGYEPTYVVEYEGGKVSNVIIGENKQYPIYAYSIGELIEMLPMEDRAGERSMVYDGLEWVINWDNDDGTINQVVATEFVDALYDMIVKLKENGIV